MKDLLDVNINVVSKRFYAMLKEVRQMENKTQYEFARELDMLRTDYCKLEGHELKKIPMRVIRFLDCKNYNVDYFFTEYCIYSGKKKYSSFLTYFMKCCSRLNVSDQRIIYRLILNQFLDVWKWNLDNYLECCLQSEIKILIELLLDEEKMDCRLYQLRKKNNKTKKYFVDLLNVKYDTWKSYEVKNGDRMDGACLYRLYQVGYCFPSFLMDGFVVIDKLDYLLDEKRDVKNYFLMWLLMKLEYLYPDYEIVNILREYMYREKCNKDLRRSNM